MEKSTKPSGIPLFSRPSTSQVNKKPPPSQLPAKYSLTIPKSRLRARQEKKGVSAINGNPELEVIGQSKTIEEENSPSAGMIANLLSSQRSQHPEPPEASQDTLDDQFNSVGNSRDHGGDEEPGNQDHGSENPPQNLSAISRRPRMSLSDRTIETLSQIPPTPSPRRRKSGFYPVEYPASNMSRPASSLSQFRPDTSRNHRPELSTPRRPLANTHHIEPLNGGHSVNPTFGRRSISSYVPRSAPRSQTGSNDNGDITPSKPPPVPKLSRDLVTKWSNNQQAKTIHKNGLEAIGGQLKARIKSPEPSQNTTALDRTSKQRLKYKTYAPKSTIRRPPVASFFSQPPPDDAEATRSIFATSPQRLSSTPREKSSHASSTTSNLAMHSRTLRASNGPSSVTSGENSLKKSPKSSAALRDTIAKAKAARRAALKDQESQSKNHQKYPACAVDEIDSLFGNTADVGKVLRKRMNEARITGRLNISALSLEKFPEEVSAMYDLENIESDQGEWYESVDLIKLVAADNELEIIDDWAFPDISTEAARDLDDDYRGNIFRGLESMDLHGNQLSTLPEGLRRLERLTTLNLSKNRLTNRSLLLFGGIYPLRELRLSDNLLEGDCIGSLGDLKCLEVLDLRNNLISSLSSNVADLVSLRILVIAGNKLNSIPFQSFQSLPLAELDASRNRLEGVLIPQQVNALPVLKSLDVSNNSLTSVLENEATALPSLQVLNIAENRLCNLPAASNWIELVTLSAGGNKITDLPTGVTSLKNLRNLDLTHNNLKAVDYKIGLMQNLKNLCIANNPLRERRQLTMSTEDLKSELRNRLLPTDHSEDINQENSLPENPVSSSTASTKASKKWPSTTSGILDCSSVSLQTLPANELEEVLSGTPIKSILLHHNNLSHIPLSIALMESSLTALDLGHNRLSASSSYLSSHLDLPHLNSLSLASNAVSSLSPLLTHLTAPKLSTLNVSHNRLRSLPLLRNTFPALTILLASENQIADLDPESARGLSVLDVAANEISHLRPELGLLEAHGLRELGLRGNRFRVPRREVLDKGTGAVLAWLRGKVVGMAEE